MFLEPDSSLVNFRFRIFGRSKPSLLMDDELKYSESDFSITEEYFKGRKYIGKERQSTLFSHYFHTRLPIFDARIKKAHDLAPLAFDATGNGGRKLDNGNANSAFVMQDRKEQTVSCYAGFRAPAATGVRSPGVRRACAERLPVDVIDVNGTRAVPLHCGRSMLVEPCCSVPALRAATRTAPCA